MVFRYLTKFETLIQGYIGGSKGRGQKRAQNGLKMDVFGYFLACQRQTKYGMVPKLVDGPRVDVEGHDWLDGSLWYGFDWRLVGQI